MKPDTTNRARPLARAARAAHAAFATLTFALAVGLTPGASAQKADRDQPTNVEADRLEYDEARQRTVFIGRVVLTKGSLVIRGDRLVLEQGSEERQSAVATGKPASFRQKRDGTDQFLDGTAAKIEYDSATEKLVFTGGAVLTRLECGRATDEISGALIVYDARAETFSVDGKPRTDGKTGVADGGGRVRVTIQPRTDARKPAEGAATPAPGGAKGVAPCPPGAPVDLKPARRIESPRPGTPAAKP